MALRKLFDHLGSYNKAYKNWQVETDDLDRFVVMLADFLKETKHGDSEATINSDFDKYVLSHFYKTSMNKDRADLVVKEDGKTAAIFEFKRPSNKIELEEFSNDIPLGYIVGILNSSYVSVLLKNIRSDDFHIYPDYLRQIPIAPATPEQQAEIAEIVDEILAAKEADPNADISSQMAAIDEKVYALYGVDPSNINI